MGRDNRHAAQKNPACSGAAGCGNGFVRRVIAALNQKKLFDPQFAIGAYAGMAVPLLRFLFCGIKFTKQMIFVCLLPGTCFLLNTSQIRMFTEVDMKKNFYCPACGTRELSKLFITTHTGKSLSLLLSSQANIRKSSGNAICENCKHVWRIADSFKTHKTHV